MRAIRSRVAAWSRRGGRLRSAEEECHAKVPRRFRRRLLARMLVPIAPALVGRSEELPDVDPETAADGAAEMICGGPLEVLFTVISGIITLNVISLLTRGRFLRSLDPDAQADVLARAFNSRLFLVRGAGVIVGLPLKVAYYNGDDVCSELGYDRCLLVEDALKHQVTRGG